jgi:hypothetical protein
MIINHSAIINAKLSNEKIGSSKTQQSGIDNSKINYEDAYIPAFNDFINLVEDKYDDDDTRVHPCAKNTQFASIDDLSEFRYAYHDIDHNGIKELIITNGESITGIYTLVSGVPKVLLEVNTYRTFITAITPDGFIYHSGSSGWAYGYSWIWKIANGNKIVLVEGYLTDLDDDEETIKYSKVTPIKTIAISKNVYDAEMEKYYKVPMLDLSYSPIPIESLNIKNRK